MSNIKHVSEFKDIISEAKHKQVSRLFEGVEFTPKDLMELRSKLDGLPVFDLLIGTNLWNDVVGNSHFIQAMEPTNNLNLIKSGLLAKLYGMNIWSDAYQHPDARFVERRAVHLFSIFEP